MTPAFRFAPSPNGDLHLGHALSALLNFEMAKSSGGRFLLRIEDIDPARCRPEYEAGIYDDLRWLGLTWEEPVRRQSGHVEDYRAALEDLRARGLIYPAFLSRAEVKARVTAFESSGGAWPRDPDGTPLYPTDERHLDPALSGRYIAAGERHMWRLDVEKALQFIDKPQTLPAPSSGPLGRLLPAGEKEARAAPSKPSSPIGERSAEQSGGGARGERNVTWTETSSGTPETIPADPSIWGDIVLWRWDAPSSYHLSVVLDDALQGITHVVRGRDLYHATPVHRLLQTLFDLPAPIYHHHPLLLDEAGEKLSKSAGSTGLRALRQAGATPSDIRRRIGLDRFLA